MKFIKKYEKWILEKNDMVMSASDVLKKNYADVLEFDNKWNYLFNDPSPDFTMMVSGEPGSGKTTMLLEFAYYLASNFGKVLYISSEEYDTMTLNNKLKEVIKNRIYKNQKSDKYEIPKNLFFGKSFTDLEPYDFIIVDSVTELNLDIMDYRELRDIYPKKSFILVLQHTKAKEFRGSKEWEHEVAIYAEIEDGIITINKNRFGVKTCYDYFNDEKIKCNDNKQENKS